MCLWVRKWRNMETNILLESGTNELEILEFTVGGNHYGINVAKISEILPYTPPTPVPNAHVSVEGIIKPRGQVISVVSLEKTLNLPGMEDLSKSMYILTSFNRMVTAFHVHGVVGIQRVSWEEIYTPDKTVSSGDALATGIVKFGDRLVIILDFEKIVADIAPESGIREEQIAQVETKTRTSLPILFAEDSPLLSKLIYSCLQKAGYMNVTAFPNGLELWNRLLEYKEAGAVEENVSLVITDLEMPQMDGHRLLRNIKTDKELMHIPVVIFSSLINEEMRRKGESLGADAQLAKPEVTELVKIIEELLHI